MSESSLDHPALVQVKARFGDVKLLASDFRGQTTLVVPKEQAHDVLALLRSAEGGGYDYLSEVVGVDYLDYPASPGGPEGRFAVVYGLVSTASNQRLFVKVMLDPSIDTSGIEHDPALHLDTATDLWPGAEWMEREVFDMFGIRFDGHRPFRGDHVVAGK